MTTHPIDPKSAIYIYSILYIYSIYIYIYIYDHTCIYQIIRRERRQGNIHFPCSADHEQDWQPYPVDSYYCYICDQTYINIRGNDTTGCTQAIFRLGRVKTSVDQSAALIPAG